MRVFVISFIVSLLSLVTSGKTYYLRHYRNDSGLSNNTVMACLQDRRGFIWFGTNERLSRFDGFKFKIFLHNPSSANCLLSNFILSMCEDGDGLIWIGTSEGICYYMPDNDSFGTIESENPKVSGMVIEVKADNNKCLWVATYTGLFKYDKRSKKVSFYPSL